MPRSYPDSAPSPESEAEASAARPPDGPTIVGIGASAGGLAALKKLLPSLPAQSDLAYVVVVHLSPEHESHLAELLQPHVELPVQQVTETVPIEADHIYVIPPGANLSAIDTHLRLSELEPERRDRAPIDHFFHTLADAQGGHSVGVVLTGTGSDGALGIRQIKEKNGLTVAQDPTEAEYDGMPRSAIATGMVDLVLPLSEIPDAVHRFARTKPRIAVPDEDEELETAEAKRLQKIFAQIHSLTGRDFTRYKRSTVMRRIQRRMQIGEILTLSAYLERLRQSPEEVRALADDLLITVTQFFRDADVFATIEKEIIPELFRGPDRGGGVRVWSVGCATGEEAYSLAMLLIEEAARHELPPRIQIFASDLHERSLDRARKGLYPGDITTDVSEARLRRFFIPEAGGFRICKEVRDLVVFAPHNLLSDPPFSRIDLLVCRNVLIYLQRDAQREVMNIHHYALRPEGVLVLGTSETLDGTELFRSDGNAQHVFRKRNVPVPELRLPVFPLARRRRALGAEWNETLREPVSFGALHQRMVERYAPPSVLVNPDHKVVHLSEHAGRYFVYPGGELTSSIFKLVRNELRVELRAALHAAREQGAARERGRCRLSSTAKRGWSRWMCARRGSRGKTVSCL